MKAKINGVDIECSVQEFKELANIKHVQQPEFEFDNNVKPKTHWTDVLQKSNKDKINSVYSKLTSKGRYATRTNGGAWTRAEDKILKENTIHQAKRLLDRTLCAIYVRRGKLNLAYKKPRTKSALMYQSNRERMKQIHAQAKVLSAQNGTRYNDEFMKLCTQKQ